MFKELRILSSCEFVLPAKRTSKNKDGDIIHKPLGIRALSKSAKRLEGRIKLSDGQTIEKWVPHDLRRTFRTHLAKLKVKQHVAEKCLCHSLGKIVDTYTAYSYMPERIEALEKWSDYVEKYVTNNNVIPLERKKRG